MLKLNFKHRIKYLLNANITYSFCTIKPDNKFKSELDKVASAGKLKIYQSRSLNDENKTIYRVSLVMGLVSSSVVLFTTVPWALKFLNIVVFVPCFLIQLDYLLGNIKFIKAIKLLPNNQIEILDIKDKSEVMNISDLKNAKDDARFPQRDKFNYSLFYIFTNSKNNYLYHVNRDAIIPNQELFEQIVNGKKLI
jgi:hypothetical protein